VTTTDRAGPGKAVPPVAVPPELSVLTPFVEAGVFGAYEVQFVATVLRLVPGIDDHVALALAVAARAPRFGHVCWQLADLTAQLAGLDGEEFDALPWPPVRAWADALARSPVVVGPDEATTEPVRPLVWDAGRLYLQRYWHYELAVAADLSRRASRPAVGSATGGRPGAPGVSTDAVDAALDALFGPDDPARPDLQRRAAERGMHPGVSIIAGGPGTGKTYTVARLLAAAHLVAAHEGRELQVALAAPTGKAAARMGEAVKAAVLGLGQAGVVGPGLSDHLAGTDPTTVHSLLGWRDRTHFRHHRHDPLAHDMVIVDETSMVSLPLMARLLDAVRPESRLVLVGDPFQLASIEAGSVMRDVVGPSDRAVDAPGGRDAALAGRVTVLRRMRRFDEDSVIAAVAEAVRTGDADGALTLLGDRRGDVRWVHPDDAGEVDDVTRQVVDAGVGVVTAALGGDASAALAGTVRVKVLTATRRRRFGLDDWTERIEDAVKARVAGFHPGRRWHVGRPVLVTANDPDNRVFNGDVGVVVGGPDGMDVALTDGDDIRTLAPSRLDRVETWWAMTIHKSQGSEFSHVVVSLPDAQSPILTRELLYTAVTRARDQLTVVGTEAALRAAIGRPLARTSGLQERLWPD
jgi:exodeoxyribonuclease V alpha subunit